jgi:pyrimidine-specific ribonucleoside hydrolase
MPTMHTIVIDTDPGLDDAIALLLALAYPEHLHLAGVTTVAGNQTIEKVTANALAVLSFAGARVPVAAGAREPLEAALAVASWIHGDNGIGGVELPIPAYGADPRPAGAFLADLLETSTTPVSLVAIGPLTNLAQLFRARPDLKHRIAQISLMGGSASAGNMTPAAEFNVWSDPEAAAEVYAAGIPLVMSGLDVTQRAYITPDEVARLAQRGPASRLVAQLIGCYAGRYERAGLPGAAVHDACAVATLLRPDLFTGADLRVEVETKGTLTRGMTVADRRPGNKSVPNTRVLLEVDRPGFLALLFEGLARLDRKLGYPNIPGRW